MFYQEVLWFVYHSWSYPEEITHILKVLSFTQVQPHRLSTPSHGHPHVHCCNQVLAAKGRWALVAKDEDDQDARMCSYVIVWVGFCWSIFSIASSPRISTVTMNHYCCYRLSRRRCHQHQRQHQRHHLHRRHHSHLQPSHRDCHQIHLLLHHHHHHPFSICCIWSSLIARSPKLTSGDFKQEMEAEATLGQNAWRVPEAPASGICASSERERITWSAILMHIQFF